MEAGVYWILIPNDLDVCSPVCADVVRIVGEDFYSMQCMQMDRLSIITSFLQLHTICGE